MIIRRAIANDAPQIADLAYEYDKFEHKLDPTVPIEPRRKHLRFFKKKLNSKTFAAFVAEKESELVGFINGEVIKAEGTTLGIAQNAFLREAYRGKSIGYQLVRELFSWFTKQPISRIQSFVRAKNKRALRFWKKLGSKIRGYQIEFHLKK